MYFSKFKPFIFDLLSMLTATCIVVFGIIYNKWIEIKFIKINIVMIILIIMLLFYFFQLFNQTANIGIRAIFDFIFKKYLDAEVTFLEQSVSRRTAFSDKYGKYEKGHKVNVVRGRYYNIICECNGRKITLLTTEPMIFKVNVKYKIRAGLSSMIILDCCEQMY